jgi:hypothetical protein
MILVALDKRHHYWAVRSLLTSGSESVMTLRRSLLSTWSARVDV